MLVWPSQIEKSHLIDIDVKNMSSLGRGKGFKFVDSEDSGLVDLVKNKIKLLYQRYFETAVLRPGIRARASILLGPEVVVFPGVKYREC